MIRSQFFKILRGDLLINQITVSQFVDWSVAQLIFIELNTTSGPCWKCRAVKSLSLSFNLLL